MMHGQKNIKLSLSDYTNVLKITESDQMLLY